MSGSHPAGTFTTVALGDSVPAAAGCTGCTDYLQIVGNAMAGSHGAVPLEVNLAANGAVSSDVTAVLATSKGKSTVASAQLVLLTVGANDLDFQILDDDYCTDHMDACADGQLATVRQHLADDIAAIRKLAPQATIVVTGYWNVTIDGQVAKDNFDDIQIENSLLLTQAFNDMVKSLAASEGVVYVDEYDNFQTGADITPMLTPDGDHLSQAGQDTFASAIVTALS